MGAGMVGSHLVVGASSPKPSSMTGLSERTASGTRRLPLIISLISTSSCATAWVSPDTVDSTAGLPPS